MYVFGYGSLVAGLGRKVATGRLVHAEDLRRTWNVSMDNRLTVEGYKYYVDPDTDERPSIFVTFLNVMEDLGSTINGVILPVDTHDFRRLDERERNYDRVDVTERIVESVDGPVWAYVGSLAARERYEEGFRRGTAVVDAAYHESVRGEFRRLGAATYAEFMSSTDEPACPIRRLRRRDLKSSGEMKL
jgi:Gamma-glutamyl cyclotransferase, AIG2-like